MDGASLGKERSWHSGRRDKAPYGEQVVAPWLSTLALCCWLEENPVSVARRRISATGSFKALSRAGKLSQAWQSFSLSPVSRARQ